MNINCYSDIYKDDNTLRPYQQKAKKEIFESWDEVDNVMFQMPTGTGKTRLFTSIIRDINDYSKQRREAVKILIIAHRTELIDQIDESLTKYHVPHNVIAGGRDRNYKFPVNVASIQTITHPNNLKDAMKLKVQFVIIDEAHHALATTYKKLWKLYPGSKKLGVTATPWRMNHQSFLDLFDKLVLSMPIKDFIKQGYLAPYKYFSLKSDSDIQRTIEDIELDKFGEYKESSMEEKMDIGSIRAQLLDSYLSLAEGKKGIIYAINIVHAKHICEEFKKAGYTAVSIDSKTPAAERKELVGKFKKGQIDIIVNVDIFSEGFDCPDIEFIQLARPTRSLVKYLQQVGRGLRITENKQECIILDNVGMYSRFGLPNARRHWKQHFLGRNVVEEPQRIVSKGTGKTRDVDLSEGTEDMELIQDVYDEVEINSNIENENLYSSRDEFFPLFGITLGKTTWEQAKELGGKEKVDEDTGEIFCDIKNVQFYSFDSKVFTFIYWTKDDQDFPNSWKSKGFSWKNPFNGWLNVFNELGYRINIKKQPTIKVYSGHKTFYAEFEALSPEGTLSFNLDFNYGEDGYFSSSPYTLNSICVNYHGTKSNDQEEVEHVETKSNNRKVDEDKVNVEMVEKEYSADEFDPMPLLLENNYKNDNFVFWSEENEKIYEAYIQDDTYYIISELTIDEPHHCVHRNRVGKIQRESWLFGQFERDIVYHLKDINHLGANYTVFHYQIIQSDQSIKDKYFDYKGREIENPTIVEEKYQKSKIEGHLHDYIDVPVSKATFRVEILKKSSNISIIRTIKGESKMIALFPLQTDFGRRYFKLYENEIPTINKTLNKSSYNKFNDFVSNTYYICNSDFDSFSVRCNEEERVTLLKFDLKGKLLNEDIIAEKNNVQNNTLTDNDIDKLWHVFDKKATTYKYFWFLSIIQLYNENKQDSISYKQILVRMISNAWRYVFNEESVFPISDQIPLYINTILPRFMLTKSSRAEEVESQILYYYERSHLDRLLSPLLKNVPFRFLSPWIPFTTNEAVTNKSRIPETRCLYELYDDHINISSIWKSYLTENYEAISHFIENSLKAKLSINDGEKRKSELYNFPYHSLSQLLKGLKMRRRNEEVINFYLKYNLPLSGKISPKDILDLIPVTNYTIDSNGRKKLDIPAGKWTLKLLDDLLSK